MSSGTRVDWWEGEADLWAYARVNSEADDDVLVILNRGGSSRTLSNGLAFAGLTHGRFRDVLTGELFSASGDSLTVDVPAMSARVLVGE